MWKYFNAFLLVFDTPNNFFKHYKLTMKINSMCILSSHLLVDGILAIFLMTMILTFDLICMMSNYKVVTHCANAVAHTQYLRVLTWDIRLLLTVCLLIKDYLTTTTALMHLVLWL